MQMLTIYLLTAGKYLIISNKGGGKLKVGKSSISISRRRIVEIFSASSWVIATYKTFIPAPDGAGAIILRREPADTVKFSLGRTLKN